MASGEAEFDRAQARGRRRARAGGWATLATYDPARRMVVVTLARGVALVLEPDQIEGLEGASDEALSEIAVSPAGTGLHFPRLDADVYIPGLLAGKTGSRSWTAARMGAAGGQARSEAKAAAARANGAKGGRPPSAGKRLQTV